MGEVNDFFAFVVDMRLVIVTFFDGFFRADELANVDRGCVRELLQVVRQVLQMVSQVVRLSNQGFEFVLFILDLLTLALLPDPLHGFRGVSLSELLNRLLDARLFLLSSLRSSLHLREVEEPLGEEVDRVLGLLVVHLGQALAYDLADSGRHQVLRVRNLSLNCFLSHLCFLACFLV